MKKEFDTEKFQETMNENQRRVLENKLLEQMLKINRPKHCTELEICADPVSIRVFISNSFSTRNRRQLLLSLYRAVKPHLKFIKRSTIHHKHLMPPATFNKDEFAQLSIRQGIHVIDNKTQLGYFIRGIRTKLGKTQKSFAKELGISTNYLSLMETGIRSPSPKIVRRIYEYSEEKSIDGVLGEYLQISSCRGSASASAEGKEPL